MDTGCDIVDMWFLFRRYFKLICYSEVYSFVVSGLNCRICFFGGLVDVVIVVNNLRCSVRIIGSFYQYLSLFKHHSHTIKWLPSTGTSAEGWMQNDDDVVLGEMSPPKLRQQKFA